MKKNFCKRLTLRCLKTHKRQKKKTYRRDEKNLTREAGMPSDFASAAQFSEMLQTAGIEELDAGGSSAVAEPHAKHLKWEQDRWTKTGARRKPTDRSQKQNYKWVKNVEVSF